MLKLKEKLAESQCECTIMGCNTRLAYIRGFEKARKMAAKIAYDYDFDGSGDEIDYIGEEEVE